LIDSLQGQPGAPQVSVILPVYNGEEYISESIDSILTQTFQNFELILIDDGSTDKTSEILNSYKYRDNRISLISRDNRGLIYSLNEGIDKSSGRYIARMDADDISHKDRLNNQFEFMEENKDIGVLGSDIQIINHQGELGKVYHFPEQHQLIIWAMLFLCPIAHPTVMMRRHLVINAGKYSENAKHAEDYELWHRLYRVTKFANLPHVLLMLRKHSSNVTNLEANQHLMNSASVSASFISECLGRPVDDSLVSCMIKNKVVKNGEADKVYDLLSELNAMQHVDRPAFKKAINRDTARRLGMMAIRSSIGFKRFKLGLKALQYDPFWIFTLAFRYLGRYLSIGTQKI